jgi:hypothetical protein
MRSKDVKIEKKIVLPCYLCELCQLAFTVSVVFLSPPTGRTWRFVATL